MTTPDRFTVRTVPDGFESGSDVATMCLLGYDPAGRLSLTENERDAFVATHAEERARAEEPDA